MECEGHGSLRLRFTTWLNLRITFSTIGVDVPNLVTYLNHAPIVELYDVRDGYKNTYQKDTCLKKDWIMCSKCDGHFWVDNQHNWGEGGPL
jgi:hypothetical protein